MWRRRMNRKKRMKQEDTWVEIWWGVWWGVWETPHHSKPLYIQAFWAIWWVCEVFLCESYFFCWENKWFSQAKHAVSIEQTISFRTENKFFSLTASASFGEGFCCMKNVDCLSFLYSSSAVVYVAYRGLLAIINVYLKNNSVKNVYM